jgi:predicted nucleotidyltransferase
MSRTRVARVRNAGGVRGRGRSPAESSRRLRPAARETAKRTSRIAKGDPWHAIEGMVRRIVKRFDPERIILFGSYARGTAGPDSDVDLLVVMPVTGSLREKAIEIGVALHGFDMPKDIVVTTPEDFAWRKDIPGTIERPAALEGRVLYARS